MKSKKLRSIGTSLLAAGLAFAGVTNLMDNVSIWLLLCPVPMIVVGWCLRRLASQTPMAD